MFPDYLIYMIIVEKTSNDLQHQHQDKAGRVGVQHAPAVQAGPQQPLESNPGHDETCEEHENREVDNLAVDEVEVVPVDAVCQHTREKHHQTKNLNSKA